MIDCMRFVQFGVVSGILRYCQKYPIDTGDAADPDTDHPQRTCAFACKFPPVTRRSEFEVGEGLDAVCMRLRRPAREVADALASAHVLCFRH